MVGETYVLDDDRSGVPARPAEAGAAAGLQEAVFRLRRELSAYRPLLPDRGVAEDELDALALQAAAAVPGPGSPDTERLRHSLLLVAAALGSVSALAGPLDALRGAVEDLAPPR
ncbi:DUF5955 family protein [Streptomyces sp. V4-01]|uniref:DUF5955 family protein n=1 Tax=Actinacidiphila polyblastidii TaxID=3110430 RepID=A0ABU7PBN4_9ACTN|nr:DUF5955 family protein [Streptomyces sp. V4-01]